MLVTRDQPLRALVLHHVDRILGDVCLQRGSELRPFGVDARDEVLDRVGVEQLPAEVLGDDAGTESFSRRVDGRCGTGRSTADDQHVEGILGGERFGAALDDALVDLRDQLVELQSALSEVLSVQEVGRHRHDLARLDLVLKHRAVDRHRRHVRVQRRHQVERLDDVGTALTGLREVDLEAQLTAQLADLLQGLVGLLRRMSADVKKREDQRGELVPERQSREANARRLVGAVDAERGDAFVPHVAGDHQVDEIRSGGDVRQQRPDVARGLPLVQPRGQDDGVLQARQVRLHLLLEIVVEHGFLPTRQILPTRSSEGLRVFSPSFHLAGQTSPGWDATYCAARTLRRSSSALRPIPLSWIS